MSHPHDHLEKDDKTNWCFELQKERSSNVERDMNTKELLGHLLDMTLTSLCFNLCCQIYGDFDQFQCTNSALAFTSCYCSYNFNLFDII